MREPEWRRAAAEHRAAVRALIDVGFRGRGARVRELDPVSNFVFEYYSFKPSTLLQYSPGLGTRLEGLPDGTHHSDLPLAAFEPATGADTARGVDPMRIRPRTLERLRWTRHLLAATHRRPPLLHCYNLHEWAMLYSPEESASKPKRHQALPLRVTQAQINSTIDAAAPIRCTHFDAVRFFSEPAQPLNRLQMRSRLQQTQSEQPGCLHSNMDLFKWALKIFPFVESSVVVDALRVAVSARKLDVRASPYDSAVVGLDPVAVETPQGRREYAHLQREIYEAAQPVRNALIDSYDALLENFPPFEEGQARTAASLQDEISDMSTMKAAKGALTQIDKKGTRSSLQFCAHGLLRGSACHD